MDMMDTQALVQLESLPNEMLEMILKNVPMASLKLVRLVNKKLSDSATNVMERSVHFLVRRFHCQMEPDDCDEEVSVADMKIHLLEQHSLDIDNGATYIRESYPGIGFEFEIWNILASINSYTSTPIAQVFTLRDRTMVFSIMHNNSDLIFWIWNIDGKAKETARFVVCIETEFDSTLSLTLDGLQSNPIDCHSIEQVLESGNYGSISSRMFLVYLNAGYITATVKPCESEDNV